MAPSSRDDGVVEVTVGAPLTVKTPVPVPTPASPLVTVTLEAPVVAEPEIVMLAVSVVAFTKVVELTVIPVPENEVARDAPVTNPVPVIVMFWLVAPWPRDAGLVEVTVGAALTVKTLVPVPTPASPLVTVTLEAPVVAEPEIVMLAVSVVAFTKVVELTVIPVPENEVARDAPVTNPVPVIVMFWLVAPWPRDAGLVEVTVGAALTVKTLVPVAKVPSPLVTATLRTPVVAELEMVMLAVSVVAFTKVVELTVIPVPEKEAMAPLTKFVPKIEMFWLVAPWPRDDGLVEVTVGAALTVKTLVPVPTPASGLVTVTLLAPVVADGETVMLAVSEVALTKAVELTVIPVPEKVATAPVTNPVPLIVMF